MNDFFRQQLKGDRVIWFVYALLVVVSLIEGYSSQSFFVARASSIMQPFLRHVVHLGLGFGALVVVLRLPHWSMRMGGYFIWVVSVLLLIYASLRGSAVNGGARWVFGIQPSELAKIGLILMSADWIMRAKRPGNEEFEKKYFKWFAAAVFLTCGLIFTENLSTAALLFCVVVIMMWCGGIAFKRIAALFGIVVACVALVLLVAFIVPQSHFRDSDGNVRTDLNVFEQVYYKPFKRAYTWVARLQRFDDEKTQDETLRIQDNNRQVLYGQIAIARGGFLPHMPGSSEVRNKLPQAYSDFVYSIIVEELGSIIGGMGVMALYLILLFRTGRIATKTDQLSCSVLAIGVSTIIVLQALVHMAVCVQLIPVTGQPLPLITRGGTSIIVTSIYFGILLNVSAYVANNRQNDAAVATPTISSDDVVEYGVAD
ncbi:MAG: FtsW/RodA/SpoVE family cell cycle protein [Paludibacteraceae bacterium]